MRRWWWATAVGATSLGLVLLGWHDHRPLTDPAPTLPTNVVVTATPSPGR